MNILTLNWSLTLCCVLVSSNALAGSDPPQFMFQWGSNGAGEGQFAGPHGIVVDAEGSVYVVDTSNHRIQKFTSEGEFLLHGGPWGQVKDSLTIHTGLVSVPRATYLLQKPATTAFKSSLAMVCS